MISKRDIRLVEKLELQGDQIDQFERSFLELMRWFKENKRYLKDKPISKIPHIPYEHKW